MDFENLRNVIAESLGCDIEKVTLEAKLMEDLEADSLAAVELSMALEEATGITIDDADLPTLKTVGDIMAYLTAHQN